MTECINLTVKSSSIYMVTIVVVKITKLNNMIPVLADCTADPPDKSRNQLFGSVIRN